MALQTATQAAAEFRIHDEYTVGWVCALPKELTAATAMLDQRHESLPKPPNDPNTYTLGSIGKHNIVIACLPKGHTGNSPAATVVTWMVFTFPAIKFGLMVGIGSGILPKVRLGDVVVSVPVGSFPGVVQWDFGKTEADGFERTGALDNPPRSLLTALTKLETEHELIGSKIPEYLDELKQKWPRLAPKYLRSDSLKDILFKADYSHVCQSPTDQDANPYSNDDSEEEENCHFCDKTKIVKRKPRDMRIHYGLIASGNQVIESATVRDKLNKDLGGNILCVELEAAGLMNNFPCVIIRGICDYADSHNNKCWQEHAAAVAAAFAKELLQYLQPSDVHGERTAQDILNQVLIDVSTTRADVSQMKSKLENEEDLRVLKWITPVDYGPQHSDFLKRRQPGTGQWLLDSSEYQMWLETKKQTLFCPGIPGAGKTILTSIVINDLEKRFEANPTIGIAYIYCNYRRQKDQEIENLLSSLLKQLSQAQPSLPDGVKDIYEKHKPKQTRPSLYEILAALHSVVEMYSRVFIIVDALDECPSSSGCRQNLLAELFNIQQNCGANFLMTSRFIPDISERFEASSVLLEIRASTEDVEMYLKGHVELLPAFVQQNQELQETIIAEISEAVDGMFLLAQIYMYSLKDMVTPKAVRRALKGFQKLAPGSSEASKDGVLADAYEQVMVRINEQRSGFQNLATHVLSWIICAERQMTTTELQHALAVELGEPELDKENVPSIQDIVSVCAGLVTVEDESRIIRLVHYTTQEYFNQTRKHWFPDAEVNITNICITYLSFSTFGSGPCQTNEEFKERLQLNPLYDYATHNWGHHARKASRQLLPHELTEFLECKAKVDASVQAERVTEYVLEYSDVDRYQSMNVTSLHLTAYFGIEVAVKALLDKGVDIDPKDSYEQTPLSLAAQNGHEAVVRLLLAMPNINPNIADFDFKTPLYYATLKGYKAVVKQLLSIPNIDPNIADYKRKTPLSLAAKSGHGAIVKQLLSMSNIDPNISDYKHKTPLLLAAKGGHEAIVKQLLSMSNIDPNIADCNRKTPLLLAVESGHEAVIKQLLSMSNIDPNIADCDRKTSLQLAVENGHEAIVRLLLTTEGIDINSMDQFNMTPLLHAANLGHEAIVGLLLEMPGINLESKDCLRRRQPFNARGGRNKAIAHKIPAAAGNDPNFKSRRGKRLSWLAGNTTYRYVSIDPSRAAVTDQWLGPYQWLELFGKCITPSHSRVDSLSIDSGSEDICGDTALIKAANEGHEAVVKLLLAAGADLDSKNHRGETPLLKAANEGHEAIVQLLLTTGANLHSKDIHGNTALMKAVNNKHEAIVELLLTSGADPDVKNSYTQMPLLQAAMLGHIAIVKLLLTAGANPDFKDNHGRTPLWKAADNGHEVIIELLLTAGANPDVKDSYKQTPLLQAARFGHTAIVKLLLAAGVDPEFKDDQGESPLWKAVQNGYETVVSLLLTAGANPDVKDSYKQTLLLQAARFGHTAVIKVLLAAGVDPDFKDDQGESPLWKAVQNGYETIVSLLLAAGIDLDPKGPRGEMLLMLAVRNGHENIVSLLLAAGVDPDPKGHYGKTPLMLAVRNGHEAIVSLLLAAGFDLNNSKNRYRKILLWEAVYYKHEAIIQLLLAAGIDPNPRDPCGRTPLMLAVCNGSETIVSLLLAAGVDPCSKDCCNCTPLSLALSKRHAAIVRLLLRNHAIRLGSNL